MTVNTDNTYNIKRDTHEAFSAKWMIKPMKAPLYFWQHLAAEFLAHCVVKEVNAMATLVSVIHRLKDP